MICMYATSVIAMLLILCIIAMTINPGRTLHTSLSMAAVLSFTFKLVVNCREAAIEIRPMTGHFDFAEWTSRGDVYRVKHKA